MNEQRITKHNDYVAALQAVGKTTHGRANTATVDILTPEQLDAKPVRLTEAENNMIEAIDTIFLQDGESYTELEKSLTKIYDGEKGGIDVDFATAISAYDKLALNQKITIKNRILNPKGNGIQGMLIGMNKSLEDSKTIIAILERVTGKDAGEISSRISEIPDEYVGAHDLDSLANLHHYPKSNDNNVIVNILDGGFDHTNPDFLDKVQWKYNTPESSQNPSSTNHGANAQGLNPSIK